MRELRQNWLDIFSAFRIAMDPKKILLGFVGVFLSVALLWIILFALPMFPQGADKFLNGVMFWTDLGYDGGTVTGLTPLEELTSTAWRHLTDPGWHDALLGVIVIIVLSLIWAFFGGGILRGTAVEFCKDDRPNVNEATAFARKKFWSFFWAPLVPLIGIVMMLVCVWIWGLIGQIPWVGPVVAGLIFFLAVLAGFLIVLMMIGGGVGLPLMAPTIAVEGTDAFDAVSRAFSYVFGRPWRFIWYYLVGLAYTTVCVAFVAAFAWLLLKVVYLAGAAGMGDRFEQVISLVQEGKVAETANIPETICAWLVLIMVVVVWGVVAGFKVSMLFSLNTIAYCLLRRDVDGTDMSEVYIEEEEEEIPPSGEQPSEEESEGEKAAEEAEGTQPQQEEESGQAPEESEGPSTSPEKE